jgi:hypothetical protein
MVDIVRMYEQFEVDKRLAAMSNVSIVIEPCMEICCFDQRIKEGRV